MTKIVAGLIGLGTVGSGVVELLKTQDFITIKTIAVKDPHKKRPDIDSSRITCRIEDIIDDPEIELVIEVAGGINSVYEHLKTAIKRGKHIITANKKLLATHGPELFALAKENNVRLLFEASVAGGIPLISTLQQGLPANEILSVCGILNGTTNFILSKMSHEGSQYSDALKEAQSLGLAETDPTDDVEGFDVAYKLCILSALSFGQFIDPNTIRREGISRLSVEDVETARRLNCSLKLVALGSRDDVNQKLDLRVHPVLVPNNHALSGVNGANNAIIIEGSAAGRICLSGPGAGKLPTASAVVGDVITLCQSKDLPVEQKSLKIKNKQNKEKKSQSAFKNYLRLALGDASKPGVLISSLIAQSVAILHMERDEKDSHSYAIVTDRQNDDKIDRLKNLLESNNIKVVSRLRILEDETISLSA
ncbi:MAG: homoserine dehydrogenase [Cyanobacteria bacterium TGS_CYA1]|nr:homoserine dehydrogenase [Cyanobacteria bacterium TGS_CYA1]